MKWERFSYLREKEVINICDGKRLGFVCDFEFERRRRRRVPGYWSSLPSPQPYLYHGLLTLPPSCSLQRYPEEDVEEGVVVRQGGMPGYEHREYVAGDSPRRVNYKLSAKKQKLMVRLDESNGYATTNLYITENAQPVCCDKAFALAKRLIIRGGTVKIIHKGEERTAATPETLDRMREWLAFREYAETEEPFTDTLPADATVIFSGNGQIAV